jgi:hypothetical protein
VGVTDLFFQDMSPYVYLCDEPLPNVYNVGWLDTDHPFPRGTVSERFLSNLQQHCKTLVRHTRGPFPCPFCDWTGLIECGSAEVWIKGKENVVFAAPSLIYHYITSHGYRPPQEFIDAVETTIFESDPNINK